jgi:glycerol-3-phosphate acyltransferase PlsY
MFTTKVILMVVGSYLLGSLLWAYIIAKIVRGIDIRDYGNPGGGTVFRTMGWRWATLVGILDVGKAVIPTLIAMKVFLPDYWPVVFVAVAAVIGHNWPIFFRFSGGGGLACGAGILACLMPKELGIVLPFGILAGYIMWKLPIMKKAKSTAPGGGAAALVLLPFIVKVFHRPEPLFILSLVLLLLAAIRQVPNVSRRLIPIIRASLKESKK